SRQQVELSEVDNQLQRTLGYKNFTLMGSQIVRSKEGRGDNYSKGVADLRMRNDTAASKNPVFYSYNIRSVALDQSGGQARVQIEEFSMDMNVPLSLGSEKSTYQTVGFRNPVSLREGDKVDVGK